MHSCDIWATMTDDEKLKMLMWALDTKDKMFNDVTEHDAAKFVNWDWLKFAEESNAGLEDLPERCQAWFAAMVEEAMSGH